MSPARGSVFSRRKCEYGPVSKALAKYEYPQTYVSVSSANYGCQASRVSDKLVNGFPTSKNSATRSFDNYVNAHVLGLSMCLVRDILLS